MNTQLNKIDNIIQDITYLAEEIREEQGGSNEITTRLRSCASDLDDIADMIANPSADDDEDDYEDDDDFVPLSSVPKRSVRESGRKFNESQIGAKEGYQYRVTVDWTWETRNAWNNSIPWQVYVGVPFDVVDSGDAEGYISDCLYDEYGPFNNFQFRRVG